ncbi:MAG: FAD-binding oxidoreductase [Candidatus Bathyarchaeia archaeon]
MKFEIQVKEIIPRTDSVLSFKFTRPAALNYKPGQYLLVIIKANEKSLTKPLSFSSSPTEKEHIEFPRSLRTASSRTL